MRARAGPAAVPSARGRISRRRPAGVLRRGRARSCESAGWAASSSIAARRTAHGKFAFLQASTCFCVPEPVPRAEGTLPARGDGRGVPVVAPAHGALPEIIAAPMAGTLTTPGRGRRGRCRACADAVWRHPRRRRAMAAAAATRTCGALHGRADGRARGGGVRRGRRTAGGGPAPHALPEVRASRSPARRREAPDAVLTLSAISKSYPTPAGALRVLDDVSLGARRAARRRPSPGPRGPARARCCTSPAGSSRRRAGTVDLRRHQSLRARRQTRSRASAIAKSGSCSRITVCCRSSPCSRTRSCRRWSVTPTATRRIGRAPCSRRSASTPASIIAPHSSRAEKSSAPPSRAR